MAVSNTNKTKFIFVISLVFTRSEKCVQVMELQDLAELL